jgi:hypothetical protein
MLGLILQTLKCTVDRVYFIMIVMLFVCVSGRCVLLNVIGQFQLCS